MKTHNVGLQLLLFKNTMNALYSFKYLVIVGGFVLLLPFTFLH